MLGHLRLIIAAAAMGLIVSVGILWRSEFSAAFSIPSGAEVFSIAERGRPELTPAGSTFAMTKQMMACDDWMTSAFGVFANKQAHENIAMSCDTRADSILAHTPSFSVAYLVKSGVARSLGDTQAAAEALALSQKTAPNEGFLATRRLRLAFLIGAEALGHAAENDIIIVTDQNRYRGFVAQYYWAYPQHRDWLTRAFEKLEPQQARRVLNAIKQAAPRVSE